MQHAVIYVRVSSDEQVKGMSLDFQKQDCLSYAQKKSIQIEKVFEERGESAKFADRPELIGLLEFCRKRRRLIDTLIIWKLDRLSRNQLDYYYLKRTLLDLGIAIHSATEPTMEDSSSIAGKIFETFSALQAEIDNTIRSERARRGLEAKIMTGIYPWKPPIGYMTQNSWRSGEKKTKADLPDPDLFPIIQSVLRDYATGRYSQADLVRLLDERGFARTRGRKTYPQIVNRLLYKYLNYYRGVLVNPWSGESIQGRHSAMLTEDEYQRISAVRDGRSTGLAVKRRRDNPLFPLRRLLVCPDCGRFYTASVSRGKSGARFAYYHCVSRGCPAYGKGIPKATVEEAFARLIAHYSLSGEYLERLQQHITLALEEMNRQAHARQAHLERSQEELEQKKKRVYEMREDGSYTKDEFLERKIAVERELDRLRLERSELTLLHPDLERIFQYAGEFLARFGGKWERMPEEIRREFQKLVFPAGIEYRRNCGFGTPQIGPIFAAQQDFFLKKSPDAGWRGIDWNTVTGDLRKLAKLAKDFILDSDEEKKA